MAFARAGCRSPSVTKSSCLSVPPVTRIGRFLGKRFQGRGRGGFRDGRRAIVVIPCYSARLMEEFQSMLNSGERPHRFPDFFRRRRRSRGARDAAESRFRFWWRPGVSDALRRHYFDGFRSAPSSRAKPAPVISLRNPGRGTSAADVFVEGVQEGACRGFRAAKERPQSSAAHTVAVFACPDLSVNNRVCRRRTRPSCRIGPGGRA